MFKAIISCIGFFVLSIRVMMGDMTLSTLVIRLWMVVGFSMVAGAVLDLAFNNFYEEAVKKMRRNEN